MFICPKCNQLVPDPTFVPPSRWWVRPAGSAWVKKVPTCPAGHSLRSRVLGNLKELSFPWALLRGLTLSGVLLTLGVWQDWQREAGRRAVGLLGMDALMLAIGLVAFWHAWIWAGMEGAARRLTPRALGMAVGYLAPVIPATNELYFHWTHFAHGPSGKLFVSLSKLAGAMRK